MQQLHDGQCGLCVHFGETHAPTEQITSIRTKHQAPEVLLDDCGHPKHASLHLKVTPISGCDGLKRHGGIVGTAKLGNRALNRRVNPGFRFPIPFPYSLVLMSRPDGTYTSR